MHWWQSYGRAPADRSRLTGPVWLSTERFGSLPETSLESSRAGNAVEDPSDPLRPYRFSRDCFTPGSTGEADRSSKIRVPAVVTADAGRFARVLLASEFRRCSLAACRSGCVRRGGARRAA